MPLFIENKVGMMMGGDQNAVEFDTNYPDLKLRILCASQISGQLRRMDVHSSCYS